MEIHGLLDAQLELERRFVADARVRERTPKGWPAALIMFHVAQWRGRLARALSEDREGRPYAPLSPDIDALNDAELPGGAGLSLDDAAAHAHTELATLMELGRTDRAFSWGPAKTLTEALIRNSYIHPRNHIAEYYKENGDGAAADQLFEETAAALRKAAAPPFSLGAALYNLASVRVGQGRHAEVLDLLEEAAPMRPDLCAAAARDSDLEPLRDEPRFQAVLKLGAAQA